MVVELCLYLAGFTLVLIGSAVATWSYLMNERSKIQMKSPVAVLLVSMWALSGGTSLAMIDQQIAGNWVSLINTALLTLGTTAIVLTQRYHAVRREEAAKDAADALARGLVKTEQRTVDTARDLAIGLATSQGQAQADSSDVRELLRELRTRVFGLEASLARLACPHAVDGAARCKDEAPTPTPTPTAPKGKPA